MNRRDLFKFAGLGAAALLVPSTVTYFLPPRYGWKPSQLGAGYMREVTQYLINLDEERWRYDAIGRDIWGNEHQFHVDMVHPAPDFAAQVISDRFQHDGLIALPIGASRKFKLALPRMVKARYL